MSIPFDFKIFANELGKATDTLAAGILHKWQTKEKKRIWEDQQDFLTKNRKEINAERDARQQKQKKEYFNYTQSLKSFGERYGGDHNIAMWAVGKHTSVNAQDRALGKFTDELYATIGMDKDITDEQSEYMQLLPPHISMAITSGAMKRKLEREKLQKQEKKDEVDFKNKKADLRQKELDYNMDIEGRGREDAKDFKAGLEGLKKTHTDTVTALQKSFMAIETKMKGTKDVKSLINSLPRKQRDKVREGLMQEDGKFNPEMVKIVTDFDSSYIPYFKDYATRWEATGKSLKEIESYKGGYVIGKVYTNEKGQKAKYMGNGEFVPVS